MEPRKLLPALMLAVMLSLTVLIWFYPPTGDFKADNPFWNGLTTFTAQFKVSPIVSFNSLPPNANGTMLISIPYEQFTESELEKLRDYVSLGGTLTVLDDYGYGNQILNHLGLNVRFTGKPLLDPLFNYKNKWFPKIMDFGATPVTNNVSSIVLNHASSLTNTSDATIIASSSRFSYLDLNDDSLWNADEPVGPLPVVAYVRMGEGYVVAVADPSMIINSMISMDDNLNFIKYIIEFQEPNPEILIDQTHLPKTPLDEAKEKIATVYMMVSLPLGTLALIAVILSLTLIPIWRKGEKT